MTIIYASVLKRAQESAHRLGLEFQTRYDLREIDWGYANDITRPRDAIAIGDLEKQVKQPFHCVASSVYFADFPLQLSTGYFCLFFSSFSKKAVGRSISRISASLMTQ